MSHQKIKVDAVKEGILFPNSTYTLLLMYKWSIRKPPKMRTITEESKTTREDVHQKFWKK